MVRTNSLVWRSATLGAVLGTALLAIFALRTPAGAADASVSIASLAFNPASVTINVGDSVTWTNNDVGIPHTVTSDSGSELSSPNLNATQTYVHQFNTAGTYTYHCNIHPTMTGTVIVEQVAASPTASPTNTATNTPTNTPTATTTAATSTATPTGTATQTPTLTATSTATAPATATATSVPPTATNTGVTSPASPTPGAPNTGEGAAGTSSNAGVIALALAVMAVVGASGAAFALRGSFRE